MPKKKNNPVAKELRTPRFRPQRIPNKKPPPPEMEIEWGPEEIYDAGEKIDTFMQSALPQFMIDKMCKKEFGHTNWARLTAVPVKDLIMNPHIIDYDEGIIYYKHDRLV